MSRKERIEQELTNKLSPSFLSVENESGNHHVPEGSETHFKVTAVSAQFTNLSRIARHRMLNELLSTEFTQGLHALSMHLYTEDEWAKMHDSVLKSPSCKDGYKNN